jgi:hypothetical protein
VILGSTRVLASDPSASGSIGSPFAGEELYDEYDDQDIAESESEWLKHPNRELEIPQSDRRDNARHAVLAGLGESGLWTTVSARWLEWIDQQLAWSIYGGIGNFPSTNIDSRYTFVAMSKGIGSRIQWWPSPTFPLGVSAEGGLFQWTVKAKCGPGILSDQCSDGRLNAMGAAVSSGLLLSWLAEESIVIEWTIMGFKYTKMTKSSWSGGDSLSDGEGEARSSIVGPRIISFANLSLGWRF